MQAPASLPTDSRTGPQQFRCIDLAKFICALLIIAIHVQPFGSSGEKTAVLLNHVFRNVLARIAVPFFFTCSGFFLYRKTPADDFRTEPTRKTVLHLLRLYLIWTLIYFPIRFRSFLHDPKGILHAVFGFVRDFVFSGSFLQLWYLPALIFSVLLISFLLKRKARPGSIVLFAFFLYLIGLLAQSWFGLIRPLSALSPKLWQCLKIVQKVIYSTRDGLFDGFLFVGLGMLFAFRGVRLPKSTALKGWVLSMILLAVESFTLERLGFVRERDMYLSLVPATIFGFSLAAQIELPAGPVYRRLRKLSSLIFFSHELAAVAIADALGSHYESLSKTPLLFLLTAVASVLLSLLALKLSERPGHAWLKALYE